MRKARWLAIAVLGAVLLFLGACAYYNAFYNAKTAYSEAEKLGKEIDPKDRPSGSQRPKYALAIAKCKIVLDEYPDSGYVDDALFLMGKCQFRLREYRKAIRNFDNVLTNFPKSKFTEEALFLKAIAHLTLGEEQISLDTMKRLRETYPKSKYAAEALYQLGDTFAAKQEYEQALLYYREFLERFPKHKEKERVLFDIAKIDMELKRYDEAQSALEEVAKDKKKENLDRVIDAKLLRADALNEMGRSEDAAQLLSSIEEQAALFGKRGDALVLKGRIELSLGKEDDGIATLQQVITEFPKTELATKARYLIAHYYLQSKGPGEEMISEQLRAAMDDGLKGDVSSDVRDLKAKVDRYQRLESKLEEPDSTSWAPAFELAELLYFDFDQAELALEKYRWILQEYPECPLAPRAAYAIGYIESEALGDQEEADKAYALLEDRYPDSYPARGLRGEVFLEAKPRKLGEAGVIRGRGPTPGQALPGGLLPAVSGDRPSTNPFRALRRGGPGARTTRERGGR